MVLVVDDHLDTCRMLVRVIAHLGEDATCVTSGPKALDYIRSCLPKLVILDWMMPDMSGIDVLRMIRADPAIQSTPVIMYSALNEREHITEALEAGAQGYLIKSQTTFEEVQAILSRFA